MGLRPSHLLDTFFFFRQKKRTNRVFNYLPMPCGQMGESLKIVIQKVVAPQGYNTH